MRAELVYNKSTGALTLQNKEGDEVSLWQEIKSDTASELVIVLEVEDDPASDSELPEGIE
tara:strand:+ start:1649 stop:1828 length:180 start_codon:yes stop_codon:yes gene_type:complete